MSTLSRRIFPAVNGPQLKVTFHEPTEDRQGFYQFGDRERNTYAGTLDKEGLHLLIEALVKEVAHG